MPLLVQITEDANRLTIPVDKPLMSIGRNEAADICLPESGVSWEHASLVLNGTEVVLVDHGSSNHTYVNGEEVKRCVLKHQDLIRLGDYLFMFDGASGADAAAAPAPASAPAPSSSPAPVPGVAVPLPAQPSPVPVAAPVPVVVSAAPSPQVKPSTVILQRQVIPRTATNINLAGRPPIRSKTIYMTRAEMTTPVHSPHSENLAMWSYVCGWLGIFLGVPAIFAVVFGTIAEDSSPSASTHRTFGIALGYTVIAVWALIGCYFFIIKPQMEPVHIPVPAPPPPPITAPARR